MKNIITYSVNKVSDKDLYISVEGNEVLVNAPWFYTKNKIQEAVEEKKSWILKKINENKNQDEINIRPIQIFGIVYDLKVSYKNIEKIECNILKTTISVNMPKKYKKFNSESMMDILTDKIYNKIAQSELESIMEKTRIMTKMAPEDYEIKFMKNCIAKCTEDKKIIIDPRIIKYKREIVEYIILHEFCHLKYKNHTKMFYNLIRKYIPDFERYNLGDIRF